MNRISQFYILICSVGCCLALKCAKKGDMLHVNYKGTLDDGSVFDSSETRGTPFKFPLGAGRAIKGWDIELEGMCENDKKIFSLPPELAYGERGYPPVIPPNATLHFDIQLVKIESANNEL